ncbi:MAG TPA: GntR family transcriptional regulator [Candidatus Binatia bacterium]|nr:GntR family transcriptional regulator [Candidatus Binatia bacterium]
MISRGETMQTESTILSRANLPTQIYSLLKHRIIGNEFSFGHKLTEFQLAEELGVSRTPIREALNRLVQDGFVKVFPGRGAFVASFSTHDMEELFEVREALEGMAARLAALRMPKDSLVRLRTGLENALKSTKRGGYGGYLIADREFHQALVSASENSHLIRLMEALTDTIQMLRVRSVTVPGRVAKSYEEHVGIIEAALLRNPDLAEARVREHIRNVKLDLVQAMTNGGTLTVRATVAERRIEGRLNGRRRSKGGGNHDP